MSIYSFQLIRNEGKRKKAHQTNYALLGICNMLIILFIMIIVLRSYTNNLEVWSFIDIKKKIILIIFIQFNNSHFGAKTKTVYFKNGN